jgi:hypothetical protein
MFLYLGMGQTYSPILLIVEEVLSSTLSELTLTLQAPW